MRATLGLLNSARMTTFATTGGVRRVIARTCITVKAAVTACYTRGVKTNGVGEVHRKFGSVAVVKDVCSIMITTVVVAIKGCVACLFLSKSLARVVRSISVCLGYINAFFVPLAIMGICQGKVRKVKCKLLPVVTNITRLINENIITVVTTKRGDCFKMYVTDPTT